ncbi:ferritin-like domain-containing protein [Flavobacterium endoglycinae]|uniref:Ferritin-like domain-containing protein n=1 Tax=Flavobacterium endoglycinae TaxID=2816357 RepID=A0ABX7QDZ1_9FLAO|nr:ferritin-like domain-containing protein [Flavobacterium endoglycinae]QSW89250.1 ferritin-like domain-containing protein [Flavobacterium endoglycinae]
MKTTETKKTSTKKAPAKQASSKQTSAKQTSAKQTQKGQTVKAKSDAAEGLRELFIDSLKDIYWAEKALTKALPKMAKNATSENLITAINEHLTVTEGQVERLEQVFEILGEKAVAKKCDAMEGLIKEGESIMEETQQGPVRDAGIISASQKIEHYEIASYGTLAAFALTLEEEEAAALLQQTLEEEKEADTILTEAAYNTINFDASEEDQQDEE